MQRRLFLTGSAALTLALPTVACAQESTDMKKNQSTKRLVVFYSRAGQNYVAGDIVDLPVGNTAQLARTLAEKLGADLFAIKTVKSYPVDYRETTAVARKELDEEARPAIAGELPDVAAYDEIYIGHPIW